ncbi:MAG TPA: hypothetical protein VGO40_21675 [Longimicrobium sp.]|nr:hypothetical protein [Longimicrobium sp.]
MTIRLTRAAALAAALTVPAALHSQPARPVDARANVPGASMESSARAWYAELLQIQARLQTAHNRVMQDGQVRGQQETFMRDVKVAMLRVDPGLDALAARVEGMQGQAQAAQQRGDRAQLQRLNTDLVAIQQRFLRAQQAVMRQPGLSQRALQLEQTLHTRMLQVEPETDRLLARGKLLQERLMAAQQQAITQARAQAGSRPN